MIYLPYLIITLVFGVAICYAFNWLVAFFANEEGYLPKWLNWFQTFDSSLDQPEEWVAKNWPWLVYRAWDTPLEHSIIRYVRRVFWLYRNSGYTFALDVVGYDLRSVNDLLQYGNPAVNNNSPGVAGWYFSYDSTRSIFTRGWCLYTALRYTNTSSRCFQVYLGWKLKGAGTGPKRQMLAMRINPFMGFNN